MKLQVLASVMHQAPDQIPERMNIGSDAVFVNQCDRYAYEVTEFRGHRIRFYSCAERGIGRSRNEAILHADSDICLFADEDIVYVDGYDRMVAEEFERNPRADMILFNIEVDKERQTYHITQRKRVRWYNCGRYGAVSFAVRTDRLLESGVMFSLLFGGGARYSNGEDSLFLKQFMDRGYKVYTAPVLIGRERPGQSTWFSGYDHKFFYDRGVLYHYLYGGAAGAMALRFLLKHRAAMCGQINLSEAFRIMRKGIREKGRK